MRGASPYPPGPRERFPGQSVLAFSRDPIAFLTRLANSYGDVSSFRLGWHDVVLLNHPDLVKDVLVNHHRGFIQGPGHQATKYLVGDAMLRTDGDRHLRKRRLIQPTFHRHHIDTLAGAITTFAARHSRCWSDDQSVNILQEMWQLTLRISAVTLFGTTVESEAGELYAAIDELASMFTSIGILLADWLFRFPNPYKRRFNVRRRQVDDKIYAMIREHRAAGDSGDLLSLLISAYAGEKNDGASNDDELRDETLELFMASHGTTALALSWTFYLLAQHPEVESRLLAELDSVLGGRCPDAEDAARLTYTRKVLQEAIRLYPPTWATDRQVISPFDAGGYHLAPGTVVLVSPWTMHHDARYFPDPYRFDPERWSDGRDKDIPDFAYFPFGGGPHMCPGEYLAWFEAILILAVIAPQWKMRLEPEPRVELRPRFSLETRNGIPMRLQRRQG